VARQKAFATGEPLWLSGKVVKAEKINEIERTRVRSPPRATSLKTKKAFATESSIDYLCMYINIHLIRYIRSYW
jgi:hypothetical protein